MGNCGSTAIDSAQENKKCTKKNASSAMKETTRNSKTKDTMHAKSKRERRKLDEGIEKAIGGQFQNDSDEELQGNAGQDATEEEERINVTEDLITSRGVRIVEVLSEQESLVSSLLRQIDDLTKDVNKYKEQARKKNAQYDYVCTEKEKTDAQMRRLEAQLEEVRDEKRQLLNRLSEISAVRLYDNNPNITDLNDANRPLKLAEQFSSLYDNHWTDSFQLLEQTKMNEIDIIHLLLKIVQMVFEICKEHARTTNLQLQRAILKYIGLSKKKYDETVVKEAMKIVKEYRRENLMYSLNKIRKHVQNKLKNELTDILIQQTNSYTEECTRICWLMNIRDPQMFLSLGQVNCIGDGIPGPFDNTSFVSYTCTGMYVDFVVWPALFLHEGGPLLKKGVAQGTNSPLVAERSDNLLKSAKSTVRSSKKKERYKRSLLKRVTGKFKRKTQDGLHDEKEISKMQNDADLDKKENDENNSGQNDQHVIHSANAPSSPTCITQETNNIGLSTKTNISQIQNYSSGITNVWN